MPRVPNLVKPTSSPLLAPLTHVPRTSSRRLLIQPAMKPAQTVTASTSTLRTPSTSSRIQSRSFSTSQSLFSPKISGNEPQAQETNNEADNKETQEKASITEQAQIHSLLKEMNEFKGEISTLKADLAKQLKNGTLKTEELVETQKKTMQDLDALLQNLNKEQSNKSESKSSKSNTLGFNILIAAMTLAIVQDCVNTFDAINDTHMTYDKEYYDKVMSKVEKHLPEKINLEETQWDTMEPLVANKQAVKKSAGDTVRTVILLGIALLSRNPEAASKAGPQVHKAMKDIFNSFARFR